MPEELGYFQLIGFSHGGWGLALLAAAGMTIAVAFCGFLFGSVIGGIIATARLTGNRLTRIAADVYVTVLRGVPDLLVIYLFYFGGSALLTYVGKHLGATGFIGIPAFLTGVVVLGVISGAFQGEVFRGAYLALNAGELEAARAFGMSTSTKFRRIILPQVLRYAIPGLGNVWQLALKESALISVVGLVEILRLAQIGSGATYRPFEFYITAFFLYLAITWASSRVFGFAEYWSMRGVRRAV